MSVTLTKDTEGSPSRRSMLGIGRVAAAGSVSSAAQDAARVTGS